MKPPPTRHMMLDMAQSIIKTVDEHAAQMNRRWGHNRLPHIVPIEWTERFRSQKQKWELACFECVGSHRPEDLDRVREHGNAMIRAFEKLDEVALESGALPAAPGTWSFELTDGTPIILVRTRAEMGNAQTNPPAQVWCLEEIGEIITRFPELVLTKDAFPQAEIVQMKTSKRVHDELNDSFEGIPGFG